MFLNCKKETEFVSNNFEGIVTRLRQLVGFALNNKNIVVKLVRKLKEI